jgi:thiol:disulfide interchange protein
MKKKLLLSVIAFLLIFIPLTVLIAQQTFQDPTEQLKFEYDDVVEISNGKETTLEIKVVVPPKNHLYIEHIDPESRNILTEIGIEEGYGINVKEVIKPEGDNYNDKDRVLRDTGYYKLIVEPSETLEVGKKITVPLNIMTQICKEDTGMCFPPKDDFGKEVVFKVVDESELGTSDTTKTTDETDDTSETTDKSKKDGDIFSIIDEGFDKGILFDNPFLAILIVFVAGLFTAFLPCTYPLIPLTVSYLGSRENKSTLDSFINSLIYVFGMAVIYAVLGIVAVLIGGAIQSIIFSPWVLTPLVLLFMFFMFSMFGYYEIQLPGKLQSVKSESVKKTSSKGGIFLFGMVAGLVATPCALPVVGSILLLIASETGKADTTPLQFAGNLGYGFLLMFIFAIGLGILFIILGTFSGLRSRLPKSGKWMIVIQRLFGLLMAGVSVFFLMRLFELPVIGLSSFSALLLSIGIVGTVLGILLLIDTLKKDRTKVINHILFLSSFILIGIGVSFSGISVLSLAGSIGLIPKLIIGILGIVISILLSIKKDFSKFIFPKVSDLFKGIIALFMIMGVIFSTSVIFDKIGIDLTAEESTEEYVGEQETVSFKEAIDLSKKDGKPIFLDFWATWCEVCNEFEHFADKNEEMQEFLSNFHIVRMNYDENKAFAKTFDVLNLPNFVFIDSEQNVIHREYGFKDPNVFLDKLKRELKKYID